MTTRWHEQLKYTVKKSEISQRKGIDNIQEEHELRMLRKVSEPYYLLPR